MFAGLRWADIVVSGATADISGAAMEKIADKKYSKLLAALPVIDLDEAVLGARTPYWREWIARRPSRPVAAVDREAWDVNASCA